MRYGWLVGGFLVWSSVVWAAPDNTMSIAPSAVSGTTILASDENTRNNEVSTKYNAHSHTDISQTANTLNVGDGTAGTKQVCANAADTTDSCLRWNDTADLWTVDQPTKSSFNEVIVATGTVSLTNNAILVGNTGPVIGASSIILGSTVPANFGDYSARAYNTGAESLTSGTATILTLDSERFDTDTIHSTSSNTGRLTATTAGKYEILGHAEFAQSSAAGLRRLQIRLNGATVIATQDCESNPLGDTTVACSISTYYNLVATDYVELIGTQRAVSTLNVNATGNYSPEFEMVKVP